MSTITSSDNNNIKIAGGNGSNVILYAGGADRLIVNSSGNVGIGTTTPSATLAVAGNTYLAGTLTATGTVTLTGGISSNSSGYSYSEAFGYGAVTSSTYATAVGYQANAAFAGTALGTTAAAAYGGVSLGQGSGNTDSFGVAIGAVAIAGGNGIAIGRATTNNGYNNSFAFGAFAQNTASNQMIIGGTSSSGINDVYIGNGVTSSSPTGFTLNATGGSGTDIAGATLTFAGGKATGNATGGAITFSTSNAGSSGSTLQSLSEKMRITAGGNVGIGTTTPSAKLDVAGNLLVSNSGLLQLGGTTASHVALKYTFLSIPRFQMRLADDSGYAMFSSGAFEAGYNGTVGASAAFADSAISSGYRVMVNKSDTGEVQVVSGGKYAWSSASANLFGQTSDTAISRLAAGKLAIGNGTSSDVSGTLILANIGIGTSTPAFPLDVYSTVSSDQTYGYLNPSGSVGTSSGTNSYSIRAQGRILASEFNAVSDARLKDVQFDLSPDVALNALVKLKPVSFTWKNNPDGQPVLGFLAQDVETAIPNAVSRISTENFEDQRELSYNQIVAVAVGAIKKIKVEIDTIKDQLASVAAWFGNNRFKVQGEVCVDDVCVSKEQFKSMLLNNGAYVTIPTPSNTVITSGNTSSGESTNTTDTTQDTSTQDTSTTTNSVDTTGDNNATSDTSSSNTTTSSDTTTPSDSTTTSGDTTAQSTSDSPSVDTTTTTTTTTLSSDSSTNSTESSSSEGSTI